MVLRTSMLVLAAAAAAVGCKMTQEDGNRMVVDMARRDLPKIRSAATGDPTKVFAECAMDTANPDILRKADPALAAEIAQLCEHDIPRATIRRAVDRAESSLKADPKAILVKGCLDPLVGQAKQDFAAHPSTDPELAALIKRYDAACPDG